DLLLKLSNLQSEMEQAISRGDFKEAGRINAKMNALKKRTGGRK
ncbi:MAG: UvrB/UvrC motif-containing protein, partial [Clostridia bacterium]|nr:UvrB/UvrC motif-containing protein [Clostridia bacterium]